MKDKDIRSIISDIDDAPIVNADDTMKFPVQNEEKKTSLKVLTDQVQRNIRVLAPEGSRFVRAPLGLYIKLLRTSDCHYIKSSTAQASVLAQNVY